MSLKEDLESITQGVRQSAPAEVLDTMEAAAARLQNSGIAGRALASGARMPAFALPDATGRVVDSRDLLSFGPLVVSFYRGQWCPYCNLELAALQKHLPQIRERGANLVAISPQTPDNSLGTQAKHALDYPVLSDVGNDVARRFGLVYTLDASLKPLYEAFGVDLLGHNGTDTWELPLPATYVVASGGVITGAFVDPDYRRRLEPGVVLEWLDQARAS